jgi:hypothetical protein
MHLNLNHIIGDGDDSNEERRRFISLKLRDIPHFILGRFGAANYMTIHVLFPLEFHSDFHHLSTSQSSRWFNQILYPALERIYPTHYIQHLPASY